MWFPDSLEVVNTTPTLYVKEKKKRKLLFSQATPVYLILVLMHSLHNVKVFL